MNNKTDQFLNDPIMPLLFKMSAPNTIAFFVQAIVVLTEIWFISKLGTISLAAVALAFPVLMLTQQMAFGAFGGAVTSSIARSMGSGDIERAEKLLWHALFIACAGALILLVAFLVGGSIAVYWFESNLAGIFYSAAVAMLIFGLILLISLKMGAWRIKES